MIPHLPELPVADRAGRFVISAFAGVDRREGAAGGVLRSSENLSSDAAPLLGTRNRRRYRTAAVGDEGQTAWAPGGLFAAGRLFYVSRGRLFSLDPEQPWSAMERLGDLSEGPKVFAALGERLLIWPDKKIWTEDGGLESLEAGWSGEGLSFEDGTYAGESAEANTIRQTSALARFPFRAGDAVTISGCTAATSMENNRTAIIREIGDGGRTLRFYENTFAGTGTESGAVTLARTVPDLDFLCTNENRVWGCRGDTVRCCKLGDPYNWNVFDGISTDSWSVESGTPGSFTGCAAYLGYPCFFKEDRVFKAYGNKPSNFELMSSAALGVVPGAAKTLAVAGETLIYLSRAGFVAYGGGTTQVIGDALGDWKAVSGVAGSDGRKYYVSALLDGGTRCLLVYDTRIGSWYREDAYEAAGMAWWNGGLTALDGDGELLRTLSPGEGIRGQAETDFPSAAEFPPLDLDAFGGRYPVRLWVRARTEAALAVEVSYDGGQWERAGEVPAGADGSVYLPFPVRRCESFALRLSAQGGQWLLRAIRVEVRAEDSVRK